MSSTPSKSREHRLQSRDQVNRGLTIDEAIEQLTQAKSQSRLGGNTMFLACVPEIPYVEIRAIRVENDPDGAVCLAILDEEEPPATPLSAEDAVRERFFTARVKAVLQDARDCTSIEEEIRSLLENIYSDATAEELLAELEDPDSGLDDTGGQDRESYSDTQDRESYACDDEEEDGISS